MKQKIFVLILCILTLDATARLQIRREGSATIMPFTDEVGDLFAKENNTVAPLLTTNGTGAGIKAFCSSVKILSPDQVDASRPMTKSELENCFKNGVTDITKLTIGRNGMCFLHSTKALQDKKITNFSLTPEQIFLAIVKEIPDKDGNLVPNPNQNWNDIDTSLPKAPIRVRIPPVWHGTRGDFELMVMDTSCEKMPWVKELKTKDPKRFEKICRTIRTDKNVVITMQDFELAENGDVLVDIIAGSTLGEIAIAGCNIYMLHQKGRIKALPINEVEPTLETLKNGQYPLIHSLQIYFKDAHRNLVPGLDAFIKLYSSQKIIGPGGLLSKYGIVPVEATETSVTQINPNNPVT